MVSAELFMSTFLSPVRPLAADVTLLHVCPQSNPDETTWSRWDTFSCTSIWGLCLGKASKRPQRGRSMSASVRRKCPRRLRSFAKDIHVGFTSFFFGFKIFRFKLEFMIYVILVEVLSQNCFCLCFLQPSLLHTLTFAALCVSMTSQTTHTSANCSETSSTDKASPTTMYLTGTCSNL